MCFDAMQSMNDGVLTMTTIFFFAQLSVSGVTTYDPLTACGQKYLRCAVYVDKT